jgi:phage repressor protein C with HTH and peptisase S24 domain
LATLSEILRKRRKELNLTPDEIAVKIGKSKRTYLYYEENREPRHDVLQKLAKVLQFDPSEIYDDGAKQNEVQESQTSYLQHRRGLKAVHMIATAPLIPAKAQAGYVKAVDQERYMDTLEQYALPPNVDPRGANWAYWEVQGDSMEPAFRSGDLILTSQVHPMDWENLRNFYVYVLVTDERVLIKRVVAKNTLEWVLISENEDNYPQQLLLVEYVKQLWVFRRRIESSAPPTKTFEIKV